MTTTTAASQKINKPSESLEEAPAREQDYYLREDYPIELVKDEDAYVASHPDLPGCVSFGDNPTSAVENLAAMKRLWIEGQLASGKPIPEPPAEEKYSGKFVLRIPKGLHRMAEVRARKEGVSLNAYVSNVLSGALGFAVSEPQIRRQPDHRNHFFTWHTEGKSCDLVFVDMAGTTHHGRSARQQEETSSDFISTIARRIQGHHKSKYIPACPEEGYFRVNKKNFATK